jgi:hypothetical protein
MTTKKIRVTLTLNDGSHRQFTTLAGLVREAIENMAWRFTIADIRDWLKARTLLMPSPKALSNALGFAKKAGLIVAVIPNRGGTPTILRRVAKEFEMKHKNNQKTHGGRRPGSGRKPLAASKKLVAVGSTCRRKR